MYHIRTCLFQNTLAPYRIPLFNKISYSKNIFFQLVLLSKGEIHRKYYDESAFDNIEFEIVNIPGISIRSSYERQININLALIKYFLKYKPDVIVCAGFSAATLLSFMYCKFSRTNYFIWNEGTESADGHITGLRLWSRKVLASGASCFVSPGHSADLYLKSLADDNGKPIYRSYNSIQNDEFKKQVHEYRQKGVQFKNFNKKKSDFIFLYSGQLVERKGVWELVEIFNKIMSKNRNVKLLLLGEGPEKKKLQEYALKNKVSGFLFEGFVQPPDLPKYYAIADAYILLSHKDPNPLVIFEALAAGLPIICSQYAGNHFEFVQEGKNGHVVDPFNENSVTEAIEKLVYHPSLKAMSDYSLKLNELVNYDKSAQGFIDAIEYAYNRKKN